MKIPKELQMAMMMAMVGGANVIAPKEISKTIKEGFPVNEDAIIYMKKAFSMLNRKDSIPLLIHTILDNLPLVEIMKLREVVGDLAVEILKYLDENPEFRKKGPRSFDEVKEIFDGFADE